MDKSHANGYLPLGRAVKSEFPFADDWTNLNQGIIYDRLILYIYFITNQDIGSFGSIPNFIASRMRHYQTQCELRPDAFIRFERPQLINESRQALASLVNAPPNTVAFVSNTTEGVNAILRNMKWAAKDVLISFSTAYFGVRNAVDFVTDYFPTVEHRIVRLDYPLEDAEVLSIFQNTVNAIIAEGKVPRLAIIDAVSSLPGVVFPWTDMVKICKKHDTISLVDGAHGVGMTQLDLTATDPDFFVSNCHKWLHVPRGCALFYAPIRTQHLVPSGLSTSLAYTSPQDKETSRTTPMPQGDPDEPQNAFINNFGWVGTRDDAPYMCVKDAIAWRRDVLGGEDRIISYLQDLNKRGIARVAEILGTEFLENKAATLTNCPLGNVRLPLRVGEEGDGGSVSVSPEEWPRVVNWMERVFVNEYKTFVAHVKVDNRVWVRISAQVYLDLQDYEFAGNMLKEICERIGRGEYKKGAGAGA